MSVRPSTKRFFDFNEIWHVGRGRWVMHGGKQHDPIQSQGHNFHFSSAISSAIYNYTWQLTTDS